MRYRYAKVPCKEITHYPLTLFFCCQGIFFVFPFKLIIIYVILKKSEVFVKPLLKKFVFTYDKEKGGVSKWMTKK